MLAVGAPDLSILAGDNIYCDSVSEPERADACAELTDGYALLASKPSFRGAMRGLPLVATWDDHDAGANDATAAAQAASWFRWAWCAASQALRPSQRHLVDSNSPKRAKAAVCLLTKSVACVEHSDDTRLDSSNKYCAASRAVSDV